MANEPKNLPEKVRKVADLNTDQLFDALLFESPRGMVMVAHALLHDLVRDILREWFRKDSDDARAVLDKLLPENEDRGGALRSSWLRLRIACACHLVPVEMLEKIDQLTDLRNALAHTAKPCRFSGKTLNLISSWAEPRFREDAKKRLNGHDGITVDIPEHLGGGKVELSAREFIHKWGVIMTVNNLSGTLQAYHQKIREGVDPRLLPPPIL